MLVQLGWHYNILSILYSSPYAIARAKQASGQAG